MNKRPLQSCAILLALVLWGCATAPRADSGAAQPLTEGDGEIDRTQRPAQSPAAPEDSNDVMTLSRALSLALTHNPELRAFSWEVRAAQARAFQTSLWPNPELELQVEEIGGTGQRSGFDGAETTLRLNQLVELADKRGKRTKVASLDKEISQWDFQAKKLEVVGAVTRAFVQALAAQEKLSLVDDMGRLSGELVETVSQRVEAGKDSPVEKAKASVVLANARIRRQQAITDLELSQKELAATWGSTTTNFKKVSGVLSISPVPPMEELTGLLEWHPALVQSALAVDKQKAALELEKAKTIPDVTLGGGLQRFEEADDNALVFGVTIPLPISDRNQGGRLEATYNLAQARDQDTAIRTAINLELAAAYRSLSSAYAELAELDTNVLQSAASLFDASREGYTQGKLDYLELLDAQRTLFEVRERYIEAIRSYHLARVDLERLIRRDLKSLPSARPAKARPRE